jgi:hypothetical protein
MKGYETKSGLVVVEAEKPKPAKPRPEKRYLALEFQGCRRDEVEKLMAELVNCCHGLDGSFEVNTTRRRLVYGLAKEFLGLDWECEERC